MLEAVVAVVVESQVMAPMVQQMLVAQVVLEAEAEAEAQLLVVSAEMESFTFFIRR
jgi:hypothetical protein